MKEGIRQFRSRSMMAPGHRLQQNMRPGLVSFIGALSKKKTKVSLPGVCCSCEKKRSLCARATGFFFGPCLTVFAFVGDTRGAIINDVMFFGKEVKKWLYFKRKSGGYEPSWFAQLFCCSLPLPHSVRKGKQRKLQATCTQPSGLWYLHWLQSFWH